MHLTQPVLLLVRLSLVQFLSSWHLQHFSPFSQHLLPGNIAMNMCEYNFQKHCTCLLWGKLHV